MLGEACGFASTDGNPLEFVKSNDIQSELSTKELSESCDSERGTQADNFLDLGPRILTLVVVDGFLQIIKQITENRPHGLHDLLGVLAACGVLLQAFGFGIRQMEGVLHGLSEVGSPDGECANPATPTMGDNHIGSVGANIKNNQRLLFIADGSTVLVRVNQTRIPSDRIQDSQRTNGQGLGRQPRIGPPRKQVLYFGPSRGEDADFDLGGVVILKGLVVPLHFLIREGDLLFCFVLNQPRDGFWFSRRQLGEADQRILARKVHDQSLAFERFLADQLAQRKSNNGVRFLSTEIGITECPAVWNHAEIRNGNLIATAFKADRLHRCNTDFDTPCPLIACHVAQASFGNRSAAPKERSYRSEHVVEAIAALSTWEGARSAGTMQAS